MLEIEFRTILIYFTRIAGSSNGRTSPFGGEYLGSNPSPAAEECYDEDAGLGFELGRGREAGVSLGGIIQTEGFESAAKRAVSVPSPAANIFCTLQRVRTMDNEVRVRS